jgi:pSer/pThr/pTyr-binding forkhead associated (FHA) protein
MEIEQRLGLYQVFLKLYEHHRSLLDEILQLEKSSNKTLVNVTTRCVTGIVQGQLVYLVTNLAEGKTQTLMQPQGIWTIGRDRQLSITITDRRLSRRHAVIQHVHDEGFYLVDLNSTNGSFVNGEPVNGRILLKDGDRVRLGSVAFSFLLCNDTQTLEEVSPDILVQIEASTVKPTVTTIQQVTAPVSELPTAEQVEQKEKERTSRFLQQSADLEESIVESSIHQLSPAQQSEILDRFFSRRFQKVSQPN